ncbi:MAG TPA: DUF4349 domain-containing protein [Solirubrobacteraceae bacterium]|nr:DUF4349 domain-containing protein [Solirubrobacteraceae bacterium]
MRWRDGDERPLDGEVTGALVAIDAALQGEPADPEFAELVELALILRSERPRPDAAFARSLDERVAARFEVPRRAGSARRGLLGRAAWSAGALAAAGAVAAVVVVAIGGSGAGNRRAAGTYSVAAAASTAASRPLAPSLPSDLPSAASSAAASHPAGSAAARTPNGALAAQQSGSPSAAASPATLPNRKIVQSAQLDLSTTAAHVNAVAQEVFDVVAAVDGVVESSSVTSGSGAVVVPGPIVAPPVPGGGAYFQLSVPSASLSQALTELSRLRYANVLSRTDSTQDITGQIGGAGMRLAEARALRRSLLRQLEAATTTEQVDSLKIQLRDADASIASDLATLNSLRRQVAYSTIAVSVGVASPPAGAGGGFTLGRAAHDAGRVLVIVAGVGLICLAALVPVALVAALGIWIGAAIRRRRREQALDAA